MRDPRRILRALALAVGLSGTFAVVPADLGILGAAQAQADVVSSIVVRGNQRVEAETVRSYMTVQPGRQFGAKDIDDSLKALFATGLFSDVRISREGGALVVVVVENPLINRIAFEGNKRITDEQLALVIESKPRSVLSATRLQSDVQRLLEAYRRSGRFRASVEPKIIQLPQNRVDLVFEIDEGDKTGVSRITFIGNHAFSDGRLRDVIKTRESGLLSWLRSTDTYDPDRLNADQELIRRFYTRNGYADFRMISAVADLDRERNVFFVTFTLEEGAPYTFGEIDVQTSLAELNPAALRAAARTQPGGVYDAEAVEKTIEDLVIEASRAGYAFAQVRPRATRDYERRTISITYYIDEGARVYIERINIRGNTRTRDFVIRREFDVAEGDAYNRVLIDKAERRLNNLGYFKRVAISSEPGAGPDRVIVNVDVEEQSTGEISFGAGYSTADGIIGDVALSEKNFLGRGQFVRIAVNGGETRQGYEFSFTEPYFLGYRLSAGFDVYQRIFYENEFRAFDERTTGGALRFGIPLTENFAVNLNYQLYQQDINIPGFLKDCQLSPPPAGCRANGEASFALLQAEGTTLVSSVGYALVYNGLDNNFFPRDGVFLKFAQDFAGVGGDVSFIKSVAEGRYYREIYPDWGVVGMLKLQGGYVTGLGEGLRIFDQFFIGGETVRGFAPAGIGPRDRFTRDALGGRAYAAGTAEATFPFPFLPEEFGFYGAVFADAGVLFDPDTSSYRSALKQPVCIAPVEGQDPSGTACGPDKVRNPKAMRIIGDEGTLRSSVGVGLLWRSPIGPLRADFGFAVTSERGDREQFIRFGGGTQF